MVNKFLKKKELLRIVNIASQYMRLLPTIEANHRQHSPSNLRLVGNCIF